MYYSKRCRLPLVNPNKKQRKRFKLRREWPGLLDSAMATVPPLVCACLCSSPPSSYFSMRSTVADISMSESDSSPARWDSFSSAFSHRFCVESSSGESE